MRSPVFLKMPDGRKINFKSLDEMNKFLDKDDKVQAKVKKKAEDVEFNKTIFEKKYKKREDKPIKT